MASVGALHSLRSFRRRLPLALAFYPTCANIPFMHSIGSMKRQLLTIVLALFAMQGAKASDLCFSVPDLDFAGQKISTICKGQVQALMRRQLFKRDAQNILHDRSASNAPLTTCLKYIESAGDKDLGLSVMESYTEYRVYLRTCRTLQAISHAKRPTSSYFSKSPISLDVIPPTILPAVTMSDDQVLKSASERGESAEDYLKTLEVKDRNFSRSTFLNGWQLEPLARGDFNGDGREDVLVSYSFKPPAGHDFGFSVGVLTRTSNKRPASWAFFYDFNWSHNSAK